MAISIGKKILIARIKQERSRQEVATALGVTTQTIINWETDRTAPPLDKAMELCRILGVPITDISTGGIYDT